MRDECGLFDGGMKNWKDGFNENCERASIEGVGFRIKIEVCSHMHAWSFISYPNIHP